MSNGGREGGWEEREGGREGRREGESEGGKRGERERKRKGGRDHSFSPFPPSLPPSLTHSLTHPLSLTNIHKLFTVQKQTRLFLTPQCFGNSAQSPNYLSGTVVYSNINQLQCARNARDVIKITILMITHMVVR